MIVFSSFLVAGTVTLILTPLAAALARRTDFYDHPVGYKGHGRPTPYLGGLAVLCGVAAGATVLSVAPARFAALLGCAGALLALGTLDDRVAVMPTWRILAEVAAAMVLTWAGLGWQLFDSELANLALTAAWVVGLVNAFNLMDNLDGAAATVAGVCSAGIGALALIEGDAGLAALAFAVAGACAGFLPHNLARPAKVFLGDGGSMPMGLLVAGMAIAAAQQDGLGGAALLGGAMLVGLPILDTALVVVSRTRARIPLVRAGRDHLTHRILTRLRSPRRVAIALAGAQASLCALAVAGEQLGPLPLTLLACVCVAAGFWALTRLDSPAWKPVQARPEPALPDELRQLEVGLKPQPTRVEMS